MRQLDPTYDLRPLRRAILDIYQEFAKICKNLGVRHWAAEGTLLGAVRHHGFIPWDDDFDLYMERSEYERFQQEAPALLPAHLQLINWQNCPVYPWYFFKIVDTRRSKSEEVDREGRYHQPQGLYIDIFPLDGCPETLFDCTREWIHWAWRYFCWIRSPEARAGLGSTGQWLNQHLPNRHPLTHADVLRDIEEHCRRYSLDKTRRGGRWLGLRPNWLCTFSSACFRKSVMMKFEDTEIPCPVGWDEYLHVRYGDYHQLPPESERYPAHSPFEDPPWRYGWPSRG
ncbi:MAG: LicD family protein [Kiritimatiellae bacterium]|nr:LicD family protein [Kiritimatiellia bacterium]